MAGIFELTENEFNAAYFAYLAFSDVGGAGDGNFPWPVPLSQHLGTGMLILEGYGYVKPMNDLDRCRKHAQRVFQELVTATLDLPARATACLEWMEKMGLKAHAVEKMCRRFAKASS